MSRCGCSRGGSGGVLVAGPGIDISGDGTPQRPRTIEVVPDPHVCDLAKDCMSRALCRGLAYDGQCIGVELSTDEGNQLEFDPDGSLYGTCDEVVNCGLTVDRLPDFIRGATFGVGQNSGSPFVESYERAITMGMDMSLVFPARLQDGVWVQPVVNLDSPYASPTSTLSPYQISGRAARSIKITEDPAFERPPYWGIDTLDEIVRLARGRQVLAVRAPREVSTPTEGTVQDQVNVLSRYCAQRNVIVFGLGLATAADRARLSVARAAGFDTGVYISSAGDVANNPAATLVAEGIKWVFAVHSGVTDADVQAYVAAGLDVVLVRLKLRVDLDRAQALGVRGVLADDPGYVYGKTCPRTTSPWDWPNWDSNQIGARQIAANAWAGELGRTCLVQGWGGGSQAPTTGWRMPDEANGRTTGAVLLGWAAPLPSPGAYTVTWEQWWGQLDGGIRVINHFGLMISCLTDSLPVSTDQRSGPATGNGRTSGYFLSHSVGDPASPAGTAMRITKINQGAAAGPSFLATGTSNLPVNTWVRFRAIVTATDITFQRLNTDNTVFSQVQLTDNAYRGSYMWAWKNQGEMPSLGPRFATAYRNLTIT